MKKQLKMAALLAVAALAVASCGPKSDLPGYKVTESGLYYKFETKNKKAQQVQKGDVLVAEVCMRLNNDTLYSNFGDPQRVLRVADGMFNGDLPEGLLMMHKGDMASFAVNADTMAKFFPGQMPPAYTPGKGDKVYYDIKLSNIVTAKELEQEQSNFNAEMQERAEQEPAELAKYIKDNNITVSPTKSGLYIIVNKKGNGPKVVAGKKVEINYTGYLLDGTIFDSSIESKAKEGKIYQQGHPYQPLSYTVGQMSLIPGWDEGVLGQTQGSQITLVMPSSLGYGAQGGGNTIRPYSPLVFNIEIVSVK